MTPEHINDILKICEASEGDGGFRELPQKTTLTLYLSKGGVGLTVPSIEAVALKGHTVHARTIKGDLYVVSLEDVFAANVEGRMKAKTERRAGFG
jgi:hypothetical protein